MSYKKFYQIRDKIAVFCKGIAFAIVGCLLFRIEVSAAITAGLIFVLFLIGAVAVEKIIWKCPFCWHPLPFDRNAFEKEFNTYVCPACKKVIVFDEEKIIRR